MNESCIIGTLLSEFPDALPPLIARLLDHAPDSFDDPRLGLVAKAVREMMRIGKPVHVLSIRDNLPKDFDPSFVVSLASSALSLDLAEYEAAEVWEAYHSRRVRTLLAEGSKALDACPGQFQDVGARISAELERLNEETDAPKARPIGSLTAPPFDDENELLQNRFLCRGGGGLLVGQSGQGKSSLAMQMAVLWAIGRDCFGIRPARPLRVLVIQAENDDGDMFEMFDGICAGLELSKGDRERAGDGVLLFNEDAVAGDAFISRVSSLVKTHKPDLVLVDPALAYVGGDTKDAEAVGQFLRRGLNQVLHRNNCAALVVHHTTKQKNDAPQSTHDFLYSGAGSIEWTNWARFVLSLETKGNGCFVLHAPKRGARIGWQADNGETEFVRFIRHSKIPGSICWAEALAGDLATATARTGKTKTDLLPHVPATGSIAQTVLLDKANGAGIGQKKARAFLDELLTDGTVHLWLVKRKGTNPEKRISRQAQPPQQDIAA